MTKTIVMVGVAVASLVAVWLVAVLWPPRVTLDVTVTDRRLRFRVDSNFRVNSILYVKFWKEGADDYLWCV